MNEPQKLPKGWDQASIQAVLDHYENQTEDEQAEEIEAALKAQGTTMMSIPIELADEVRAFVARRQKSA
jgi:response regulator of citrate/malate metabolism